MMIYNLMPISKRPSESLLSKEYDELLVADLYNVGRDHLHETTTTPIHLEVMGLNQEYYHKAGQRQICQKRDPD